MRGTVVFPGADRDFMQLIEIRANNGAQADVETVYVLTGETYCVPTRLFAFDDPALYRRATRNRVNVRNRRLAKTIAAFYADRPGPKLVVRVHTHPSGRTSPSDGDRNGAAQRNRSYARYFDDYELFLGIHGLGDAADPDPEWLRRPERTAFNEVAWWGENRKHKLAVFDMEYEPRPMVVGQLIENHPSPMEA